MVLRTVIIRLFSFVCDGFVFCGLDVLGYCVGLLLVVCLRFCCMGYVGNCGNFVFWGDFWFA